MSAGRIFILALFTGLSGAMMPGPLLTAVIAETSRRGFSAGPWLVTGHCGLELVLVVLLFFGLAGYLQDRRVFRVIALVGGVVLLWMAYGMVTSALQGGPEVPLGASGTVMGGLVLAGALVTLANPYWSLWWATVGTAQFGLVARGGQAEEAASGREPAAHSGRAEDTGRWASCYLGHISSDYLWYALVAYLVAFRRQAWNATIYAWVVGLCGVGLMVLAGMFIGGALRPERPQAKTSSADGAVRPD